MRSSMTGQLFLAIALVLSPAPSVWSQDTARVLVMSDIHGDFQAATSMLQRAGLLDDGLEWVGHGTTFVQTGDFTDRGPEVRRVMDLLISLEDDLPDDQMIVLMGNHEFSNMIGNLVDVTAADYDSFADSGSERRRQEALEDWIDFEMRRRERLGNPQAEPTPEIIEAWMDAHPSGFFEHREAFGPDGEYGRWLRELPTVVKVDETLFLHAGINPALSELSIDEINTRVRNEIRAFDQSFEFLVSREIALPFFTLQELLRAAQEALDARNQASEPENRDADEQLEVQVLEGLLGMGGWLTIHPDGVLWYRGYSNWSEEEGTVLIEQLLETYDVEHIVVGHTPQLPGEIRIRFDGRLYLADTGMLSSAYPGGRPSVLEIRQGVFNPIYSDDEARGLETPNKGRSGEIDSVPSPNTIPVP